MLKLTGIKQRTLGLMLLGSPLVAHGWGHQGHSIVARVGSRLTTKGREFWNANLDSMGKLTNVPDNTWKRGKSAEGEKPTHWFQIDAYFDDPADYGKFPRAYGEALSQYGEKVIQVNGTAPWRIHQFYTSSIASLKAGEYEDALELAGVMSHYIGDLSQPLHVTENYDGKQTDDPGIHKYFETDNLEDNLDGLEASVQKEAAALLKSKAFQAEFKGTLLQAIFRSVNRSIAYKDQIIATDKKYGRSGEGAERQLTLARSRLADGAATLSIVLSRLWTEGGREDEGATVKVSVPTWIPPSYDEEATSRQGPDPKKPVKPKKPHAMGVFEMIEHYENEDDCA